MNIRAHRLIWAIIFLLTCMTGAATAREARITVMNPQGIKPAIRLIPMAARPDSLDGKTVYIVDTKYPNTKPFVEQLQKNLARQYPGTNWVVKEKTGFYLQDDPGLWAEIKEQAQGAIVLIGH